MTASKAATAEHDDALLLVRDLQAYIGRSHILQGVDLQVSPGGVTVLLGRNGVGKTSTLRSVLGLMERRGEIFYKGKDLMSMKTHEIARLGIGYVPENRDVFHGLSVAENLRLAERRGTAPDYDRVYSLFPDMYQRRRQNAGSLSGGQQQMLSLSRALLNDSELLIVDEPTKGLAPKIVSEVTDALTQIAGHSTILLVEQNVAVARRLGTDVVVLAEGRVVRSGTASDVFADEEALMQLLGVQAAGEHT